MFFLIPCLYLISISPFPDAVTTSANTTLSPPTCASSGTVTFLGLDITLLFVFLNMLVCAMAFVVFFFQFLSLSFASGYGLLWILLFAPFTIIFGWVLAEFLRGNT